jgi:hypothetical protein
MSRDAVMISSRWSCQACAKDPTTSRQAGMFCRDCGGKYVPAQKGLPSGVTNAFSGQPPWPVMAWTASM